MENTNESNPWKAAHASLLAFRNKERRYTNVVVVVGALQFEGLARKTQHEHPSC